MNRNIYILAFAFLIINQAIGGFWPGDPGGDFRDTQFIIDWIKVYQ